MIKRLQNKVAESKMALPVAALYAVVVWVLGGLITEGWWLQFGCFIVATYLMVELNNLNGLIRIYSRMVSCTFIALSCCACFLFHSMHGAVMQVCIIGAAMVLFLTYQDKTAAAMTYYAFLLLGIASTVFVHIVFYLPLLWLLMLTQLQSLSWRTWGASLLGILTPYWLAVCWLTYQEDFTPLADHFAPLADFAFPFDYTMLSTSQIAVFLLVVLMAVIGTTHYIRQHHNDKIRIRLIYGFFIWVDLLTAIFLILQPQHYDCLLRIMIINTAPLVAHFLALTSTKLTNALFCTLVAIVILLTAYSLWSSSSLF